MSSFPINLGYRPDLAPFHTMALVQSIRSQGKPEDILDAAPAFRATPLKTTVLHHATKQVLGAFLPSQNQPRGTCTSRGLKRHLDLQQTTRMAAGEPLKFQEVNHAIIYGLGREIAGMLGGDPGDQNDDGCTGAAVARGVVKGGTLRYEDTTEEDNRDDDRLACVYGARGVPQKYKDMSADHRAKDVAQVKDLDGGRLTVVNGYGFTVASTVGFEPFRRDANGFCRPGGEWPHQMCVTGWREDKDWFLIDQSWGATQPPGPTGDIEIPSYSFWIDSGTMLRMIREGDSWVLSPFEAWKADLLRNLV